MPVMSAKEETQTDCHVEAICKMGEIDTAAKSDPDGLGARDTLIGALPPDYTSNVPGCYGSPDSMAYVAGDAEADVYYIAEDMGTASGEVPR